MWLPYFSWKYVLMRDSLVVIFLSLDTMNLFKGQSTIYSQSGFFIDLVKVKLLNDFIHWAISLIKKYSQWKFPLHVKPRNL